MTELSSCNECDYLEDNFCTEIDKYIDDPTEIDEDCQLEEIPTETKIKERA